MPLALPGRVIHHAEQAQRRIVDVALDDAEQRRVRQFAAEMQVVVGLHQPGVARLGEPGDRRVEHGGACPAAVVIAQGQRIEHGGDAGPQHLPVMRQHGRERRRPAHARPRLEMVLHIVGVQVDQSRQQQVALEVDIGAAAGFPHRRDLAVGNRQVSVDDGIGQYEAGIPEAGGHEHIFRVWRAARPRLSRARGGRKSRRDMTCP